MVKTRVVKIGNAHCVLIPKQLLEQSNLEGEVILKLEKDRIVIRQNRPVRYQWKQAFKAMSEAGDDKLLDEDW